MQSSEQQPTQSITLQHRVSQRLFLGCWETRRIGVIQFASVMQCLYQAIHAHDPYAVLFQAQVGDAIKETRATLNHWETRYQALLDSCRGIHCHTMTTSYSQTFPLTVTTPEAHQAALMVIDLDYLLSIVRQCGQLGLILTDTNAGIALRHTAVQSVQSTLHLPFGWRATGITTTSLLTNTPQTQQAAHKMQAALNRPLPTKRSP